MANFAEIDENNIVTQVITIHNNELLVDGVESELKELIFVKVYLGIEIGYKLLIIIILDIILQK